jgi:hypothetical protein
MRCRNHAAAHNNRRLIMRTIFSALVALSLLAGVAAPAMADGYSGSATGPNNSVNLP